MPEYEGNFSNSVRYLYFMVDRIMPLEGCPHPIIPRSCNYVSLNGIFVSYSCHKQLPPNGEFWTTEIYSLIVRESRSLETKVLERLILSGFSEKVR